MLSALKLLEAQNIYTTAVNAAMKIFELTHALPHRHQDDIGRQLIAHSGAVCENLLVAWQNRGDRAIFLERLNHASIDASNVQQALNHAVQGQNIKLDDAQVLLQTYDGLIDRIAGMLSAYLE